MKTGTITFNVTQRGREHRGQPRNFDTAALAAVVNGPEVQERVGKRDMLGYFGHWPRRVFGMEPGEGGMFDGRQISLEPAIVTTLLKARPDGTIEHEAEFLDTAPGRTAKRMFSSRTGGWSSAISVREYAGRDVPIGFHGFDYVTEPNFSTNRGYALDGVLGDAETPAALMDGAMRESQATIKVLDGLYSALQGDYERMLEAFARVQAENAELVDLIARGGSDLERAAKGRLARLDGAGSIAAPAGLGRRLRTLDESPLMATARAFDSVSLEDTARVAEVVADPAATKMTRVMRDVAHWLRK
jgi:hypothetical protein